MSVGASEKDSVAPLARHVPRGPALKAYLESVENEVALLQRAVETLPRVDANGRSECPFAEDLYARKDELEANVGRAVVILQEFQAGLEQEVERCQRNLSRIRGDEGDLSTDVAIAKYDLAADKQQEEWERAMFDRNAVNMVLPRAVAVLEVARSKKYPGKTPERRESYRLPEITEIVSSPKPPSFRLPKSTVGGEIGGLLSAGPVSAS